MKILHIISGVEKELGGPVFALNNIIALEKFLGYNSEILTTGVPKSNYNHDSNSAIHIFYKSFPSKYFASKNAKKWLKINYNSYDLFVIHGIWAGILFTSALFLRKKKKKYIIRPAGSLDKFDINLRGKKILKTILGIIFIRKILQSSYFVFCTSEKEKNELVSYNSQPLVNVLPLPFNKEPNLLKVEFKFDQYGNEKKEFKILYMSRIEVKKGLPLLIESIEKLNNEKINVKLLIAGHGEKSYVEFVKSLVIEKGLTNNIDFLGFVDNMDKKQLFEKCDLFVLPSYNENFGNVVIESLYYNVPVLISNQVYIYDVIINNNCGWVCEPTKEDVYIKLKDIFSDIKELGNKKQNCQTAVSQFSIEKLSTIYSYAYER